jgi:hypothetical protein
VTDSRQPPPPPPAPEGQPLAYPGDKWQYKIISSRTYQLASLEHSLNEHGAHGWEVVGLTSADKTIGLNSLEVLLKRKIIPRYQPPTDSGE